MFERLMQGAVDVIRGDAPLNAEHVAEASRLLEECVRNGPPYVVLDLEKVPLIDSAGLDLLLDFKETFQLVGGVLKLASPNPLCEEILSVTGLDQDFEIFAEALSAVGSFAR